MSDYYKRDKGTISFEPYASRCKELLAEYGLELPVRNDLIQMYWNGFTCEDVLHKGLFKTRTSQYMILHIRHSKGVTEIPLHNSHLAKEWFKKFPEVRNDY